MNYLGINAVEEMVRQKAREARKAVRGHEDFIFGGVSGSTDLGFVIDALKPRSIRPDSSPSPRSSRSRWRSGNPSSAAGRSRPG